MDRKEIGRRMRELRGSRSREEEAIYCKVTAQAITMYETGKRIPSDETKIKLAEFLNTTVGSLFYAE